MKYKLTAAEKADRIERRAKQRAEKSAQRQTIREWFDARRQLADKRRKPLAPRPGSRGVDRVPSRYRVTAPAPEVIHNDGTPYVNPVRDAKRAARLRREVQA